MITEIKDIVKLSLLYQNNIFEDGDEENSVFVNASDQIEILENDEEADITLVFTMKSVNKQDATSFENGEKKLSDVLEGENTLGELTVKYRLKFEVDKEKDTEFREQILEIIEPYFRKEVESLLSNMKLPNFLLPFRFWKNEN